MKRAKILALDFGDGGFFKSLVCGKQDKLFKNATNEFETQVLIMTGHILRISMTIMKSGKNLWG